MNRMGVTVISGFRRMSLGARTALFAGGIALAALAGCGGSGGGTGGEGGNTTTTMTTSTTSTTSSMTTSTTSSMTTSTTSSMTTSTTSGTGGGPSDPVVLGAVKIGNPLWEPVDYHQFSAPVGNMFESFGTIRAGLLPPPNHQDHPELGIGPGTAHAGPYDHEFAMGLATSGYMDQTTFPSADGLIPNAILSVWMMVPSTGAPTGSSPDFTSGAIIPNTKFPITVTADAYSNNVLLAGYSYGFDVPALDAQLTPPFNVDGHSHFPMFSAGAFNGLPSVPGTLETRIKMLDASGDGWDLTLTANAVP